MTQVTPAPVVTFSTAGLPGRRRVDLWESHNARALIGLRCRTLTEALLEATEINVQLERLHLARVQGNPHVVERGQKMVRRRPAHCIALFFNLEGEAFFYHDDGVRTVRPGQLLMCDADRPFMRGFSQGLEELVVKVPRDVFADLTGIDQLRHPAAVDFAAGGNAFAHALAREVGAVVRADGRPADERVLLALVSALLGPDSDDVPAAYLAAAQTYIACHLADPALSASRVAAAVGISTRHLSRVFAHAGTSVPRSVLAQRLERARTLLERADRSSPTVAQVARQCGFSSAAHFSSAFGTRFGERATDVRRRALASRNVPLA